MARLTRLQVPRNPSEARLPYTHIVSCVGPSTGLPDGLLNVRQHISWWGGKVQVDPALLILRSPFSRKPTKDHFGAIWNSQNSVGQFFQKHYVYCSHGKFQTRTALTAYYSQLLDMMEAHLQRGSHWEKHHISKVTCLNMLAGTVQSVLRTRWPQTVVDERRNQQEDPLIVFMRFGI